MDLSKKSEIKERFLDAFSSRLKPTDGNILLSSTYDNLDPLTDILRKNTAEQITIYDIRNNIEGYLWTMPVDTFLHFLPAFLYHALNNYEEVSIFASELIGALTRPEREDIIESIERLKNSQKDLSLPNDITDQISKQQLEWYDSGSPEANFINCFSSLSNEEGAAILYFLEAFKEAHGEDFPFDELDIAIARYWAKFEAY